MCGFRGHNEDSVKICLIAIENWRKDAVASHRTAKLHGIVKFPDATVRDGVAVGPGWGIPERAPLHRSILARGTTLLVEAIGGA